MSRCEAITVRSILVLCLASVNLRVKVVRCLLSAGVVGVGVLPLLNRGRVGLGCGFRTIRKAMVSTVVRTVRTMVALVRVPSLEMSVSVGVVIRSEIVSPRVLFTFDYSVQ